MIVAFQPKPVPLSGIPADRISYLGMRFVCFAVLAVVTATGCNATHKEPLVPNNSRTEARRVVVFSWKESDDPRPMNFHLKEEYGIVMWWEHSSSETNRLLRYELFNRDKGRMLSTTSQSEFLSELGHLPRDAKVDFYDTCTASLCLSSLSAREVLQYCSRKGIAGGYYIMCTDFNSIGKKRAWRWNEPGETPKGATSGGPPIRSETNTTSSATSPPR